MVNARTLINAAALKLSALGKGQTLPADEAEDGLNALNALISSWNLDGLMIFNEKRESFPLTQGVPSYTIGTGADFDTDRPTNITTAFVRFGGYDYNLKSDDSSIYGKITDKDDEGVPSRYNYVQNSPIGTIYIFPTSNAPMDLYIYSEEQLSSFPDLTTDIVLADGYERAIIYNLALELAPEYQVEPNSLVYRNAQKSLAAVKAYNSKRDKGMAYINGVPNNNRMIGNIYTGWDS